MKSSTISFVLALGGLVACSTQNREAPGQTTYSNLRRSIIKGESTQNDVIRLLGEPTKISRNARDDEVWTYTQQKYDVGSSRAGKGIVLFGEGNASDEEIAELYDLIFVFNADYVVKDYSVISSSF